MPIDAIRVVPATTFTGAVAAWTDGASLLSKVGRSSSVGNDVFPVCRDDEVVAAPVGCTD